MAIGPREGHKTMLCQHTCCVARRSIRTLLAVLRDLLIQAREEAGLSITELARLVADRTGRSIEGARTTIQRYEAEGGPDPRASTVQDVLDALGLELKAVPKSRKKYAKKP